MAEESTKLGRLVAVARAVDRCRDRNGGLPLHFGDCTPERVDTLFNALQALQVSDFEPARFIRSHKARVTAKTLDFLIEQASGYLSRKAATTDRGAEFALDLWTGILSAFYELRERRADD